ncbi:MAG: phosphate ABC transporter permease PstA [Spirochaetaceae bacterium]|nr:phosphate ABC transporter permease PstA [Spirochaetaceae bacterium]
MRGNMRTRQLKDRGMYIAMAAATIFILAVLGFIIAYVVIQGAPGLTWTFLTSSDWRVGIWPMLLTTIYVVIVSLAVSFPIGIITAVYLNEYASNPKLIRALRLAIETLAGIPSIIYGLFGLLVFCRFFGFGQSIIAGALTLSIMILPVVITSTEEALKTVPMSFREGSLALGTTKIQTIRKVVLPSAMPGIITAAILAIGRVVGESAPVLLTVGIAKNVPKSIMDSGRTLTIHLYYLTKEAVEENAFQQAFATATILVVFVIIINTITRALTRNYEKRMGSVI